MKNVYVDNPDESVPLIADIIDGAFEDYGPLRIGIPGGRGAKIVIEALLSLGDDVVGSVFLYLVDERLEGEKNEPMLMDYGLGKAIEEGRFVNTQLIIPSAQNPVPVDFSFDLLFLGVGEDGHFASLFPGSWDKRKAGEHDIIEIDESPKPPNHRVTFSFSAFEKFTRRGCVYLVCFGEGKRNAYERYIQGEESQLTLPSLFFERDGFDPVLITDLAEKGEK